MIGQTVSHYRITAELGRGGMGDVYLAEDTRLGRKVALKFLLPELARNREAVARFRNEAKAAAELSHPNIATIYDFDEADGRPFLVFEYLEGHTLKDRIARGPLPVNEVFDIGQALAEGLAEAHSHGIVHRDIKSANVMLTPQGSVKILDFGIARRFDATQLTQPGTALGTVGYMSPEQAKGETADERSDIWSLGVVLYECLVGALPFGGETSEAVIHGILGEDPTPPSGLRTGVPLELERSITKCLAKESLLRYQHVDELLVDLRRLRGTPTPMPEKPEGPRRPATLDGNRIRYAGLALAAGILAVIAWTSLGPERAESPVEDLALAVVDFRDLESPDDVSRSTGITSLVQVGLVETSPCRVVSSHYLYDLRRRLFGSGRGPIEEDQALEVARKSGATMLLSGQMVALGAHPHLVWQLVDTRSGEHLGAHRVQGENLAALADRVIEDVLPLLAEACGVEETSTPTPVSALTTTSPKAYEHYVDGLLALESIAVQDAVREFERAVALDSTFALAHYRLSTVYQNILGGISQLKPTRDHAEKAWMYRARLSLKDRLRIEAWRDQLNERTSDALATYREMLARWPDDKELIQELSFRLMWYWYFDEAASVASQGIALYPDDWVLVDICARSLGLLGRSREALEISRTYLERNPSQPQAWDGVAWRYLELALPDSAEAACLRALEIDDTLLRVQEYLAICEYYRGNLRAAIESFERILARSDLMAGQRIAYLTLTWYTPNLPLLYAESGRFERALQLYEEARPLALDRTDEHTIEQRRARMQLRLGLSEDALRWSQGGAKNTDEPVLWRSVQRTRVRALVALDSLEAARSILARYQSSRDVAGQAHLFMDGKLRVEIALAEGNPDEALTLLQEMDRRGMPRVAGLWHIEWREALARAHRMKGDLDEAARVHEEMLEAFQGHFLSHYELGRIYEEMGRFDDAEEQYTTFLDKWSQADEGLPKVEEARQRLKALQARS